MRWELQKCKGCNLAKHNVAVGFLYGILEHILLGFDNSDII